MDSALDGRRYRKQEDALNGARIMVFGGNSHKKLTAGICDHLDVPVGNARFVKFSNENLLVEIQDNVREADVYVVQTSASPVNEGIMELLIMLDALKYASAWRITAVLPYFPYARSDKKDKPRISITARLMADLIQTAGANRLLTMDLHAPQIEGFFRIPTDHLKALRIMTEFWLTQDLTNHVVVSADAGHAKDTGPFAERLGLLMAIIDKRRIDDSEHPIPANLIGDVNGKHCLMFDDEVASGATLNEGATFLKKHGALSVSAACTHPVLSGNAVSKIQEGPLDRLIVTDTMPTDSKQFAKLTVLPTALLFAKAIRRINSGESVHELCS